MWGGSCGFLSLQILFLLLHFRIFLKSVGLRSNAEQSLKKKNQVRSSIQKEQTSDKLYKQVYCSLNCKKLNSIFVLSLLRKTFYSQNLVNTRKKKRYRFVWVSLHVSQRKQAGLTNIWEMVVQLAPGFLSTSHIAWN